ncbi:RNA dependent RNA polymerase-domain-containing protein [Pilobolus umbonatus]|nr:RNA dependent RNA polymerase-domain-containing protein [Pilobolus umbonatus]
MKRSTQFSRMQFETSKLYAKYFAMGCLIGPKHFVEEWVVEGQTNYTLNYTTRQVEIYFHHMDTEYRLEYKFKAVDGDMILEKEGDVVTLTIPLRYPARFWKRNLRAVSHTRNAVYIGPRWERVAMIPFSPNSSIPSRLTGPLSPSVPEDTVDLGKWIVYRLKFKPSRNYYATFQKEMDKAAEFNLVPRDLSNCKPFMTVSQSSALPKALGHTYRSSLTLTFSVLYMLECIISNHLVDERNLSSDFYSLVTALSDMVTCSILDVIANKKQKVWDPSATFKDIWKQMETKLFHQRRVPSHCAMLRKVIITPTRMYIQAPTLETTNRVIRHYIKYADRFLRVQFTDEDFSKVGAAHKNSTNDAIYNRIYDVLRKGIQIGNVAYEFLAFSSSQLREQGCWFFAKTPDLDASQIRTWMGVFSHEKVVAKHAIRMGQCFSSTRTVALLKPNEVETIPDIKHNGYTFSDGVGKISPALAQEVTNTMELKSLPSAFQFRLGGAKGVLTVDESLTGPVKIQLRPSQVKFESDHLALEVIRTSTFIHSYLNSHSPLAK